MYGIILAGGRGERLGSNQIPKPAISIHGKTTLETVVDAFCGSRSVERSVAIVSREYQNPKVPSLPASPYFGESVKAGVNFFGGRGDFVLAYADCPFIASSAIDPFLDDATMIRRNEDQLLVIPVVRRKAFQPLLDIYPYHFYSSRETDWAHGTIFYLRAREAIPETVYRNINLFFEKKSLMYGWKDLGKTTAGLLCCLNLRTALSVTKLALSSRGLSSKPTLQECSTILSAFFQIPTVLHPIDDIRLGIEFDRPEQLRAIQEHYDHFMEAIEKNEHAS
ncbi:nucleotidyltransferase family protein [Candidatus Woesearchaeota archaeon]|nr:nucleotidyltransferase family protein [Candidatus Woesearchaeota archaeon]